MLGDSLYLENIQEYVQDEDKIVKILATSTIILLSILEVLIHTQVTYKWLSRKLDVPVNAAKQYEIFNLTEFIVFLWHSHCPLHTEGVGHLCMCLTF